MNLFKSYRAFLIMSPCQAGVGTYFDPGVVSPLFSRGAKLVDKAAAWLVTISFPLDVVNNVVFRYLNAHVRDGYHFLMQNYREGDKICLFGNLFFCYTASPLYHYNHAGFSRGAYTARALAGFLHKVGASFILISYLAILN
jgi:uncharacterized protein (DUF2235 family)